MLEFDVSSDSHAIIEKSQPENYLISTITRANTFILKNDGIFFVTTRYPNSVNPVIAGRSEHARKFLNRTSLAHVKFVG